MRMEDHFKETLHRAVANEPPVLDAWDRFEHRLGRGRRWRIALAFAGAAAVIAAAVIVVPQLGTNGVRVGPPLATPDPYEGWEAGHDPIGGWTVRMPPTWRLTSFEGVYEVLPPDEIATPAGEPTFAVTIARLEEDLEPSAAADDPSVQRGTWPEGRPFLRIELKPDDRSVVGYVYRIDWRPPCAFESPGCDIAPSTLVVTVMEVGDNGRFEKYRALGELVARSIRYVDPMPPATPIS
jgi:hypothetical protein